MIYKDAHPLSTTITTTYYYYCRPPRPRPFQKLTPGPAPVPLKSKKTLPALNNYYELYIIIRKIFILVLPILPNSNNTNKHQMAAKKYPFSFLMINWSQQS